MGQSNCTVGVEAVIEGGIHAMRLLWDQKSQEEEWGFLLVDARNAFNKDNRTAILLVVQFDCTSDTQFNFNCYRHWSTLMVRDVDGSGHFLRRKKDVNQWDPLAMILFGIGILLKICEIYTAHPNDMQPWYADDTSVG